MPAAAVIPAPIAYIKVVAVKKLVVEIEVVGRWFGFFQTAFQRQFGDSVITSHSNPALL